MPSASLAHFGAIIPSTNIVAQQDDRTITLAVQFLHPMEGHGMNMEKPKRFGVFHNETQSDLLSTLQPVSTKGLEQQDLRSWQTSYTIKRPGDYTFYVEPAPYWEPAENTFIVHYTKVCVNALGLEEGWDSPIGLETEIVPLTRPYGLWAGNLFTGQVLVNGKPAAHTEVEVEYLNSSSPGGKTVQPPSDPFITQMVKTDANGVFSYAMPRAGWWGFAALTTAERTIKKDGVERPIELGAVYWVQTTAMP
ncbi:MAG: DUF4198 domain-containing protein [Desulfobulbus sp.]